MGNKRKMGSVFLTMFLRTVVIILFLVIVAMGVLLGMQIRQAKKNKKATEARKSASQNGGGDEKQVDELFTADTSSGEVVESDTEAAGDPNGQTPSDDTNYDLSLAVLNGTYTEGLAGAWRDRLSSYGYTNLQVGNYSESASQTTVYIVDESVTTGLTKVFPNGVFIYGTIDGETTDLDLSGIQAILIIGDSDDIITQAE